MRPKPTLRFVLHALVATAAMMAAVVLAVDAAARWNAPHAQVHARSNPTGPPGHPTVDAATMELLRSVGYSAWSEPGAKVEHTGVTRSHPEKTSPGYNLYTDYSGSAYLLDMNGRVAHTWHFPPGQSREFVRLLPDGSLLAHGPYLSKLAWDSTEEWLQKPLVGDAFSHDLEVLEDGSFLVPSVNEVSYNGYRVNMEYIEHFSPDRQLIDSWSAFKSLRQLHRYHPPTIFDTKGQNIDSTDYYHANTVRVLPDTPLGRKDSRFRKGNWLICLRQVSLVAIIDQDAKNIVWGWGPGVLDHPHSPVMLPDGQIMVFDNGMTRNYSRLVKVEPRTRQITWTYEGSPRGDFFTAERGFVQPLPNGNLLVTVSEKGQALEMTASGEIVWEFFDPQMEGDRRRAIYRMVRYPAELVEPLLRAEQRPMIAQR